MAKAAWDAVSSGTETRTGPKPKNSGSRHERCAEAPATAGGHPIPFLSGASCPEPIAAWCLPTEAWAPRISELARPSRAGSARRSCQHRLPRSPAPRAATGSRSHDVVSSSRDRAHRAPASACRAPSLLLPSGLNETPPTALLSLRECESPLQRPRPPSRENQFPASAPIGPAYHPLWGQSRSCCALLCTVERSAVRPAVPLRTLGPE